MGGRCGEWCSVELEELRLRAPMSWVDGVRHVPGVEAMLGAGTWGSQGHVLSGSQCHSKTEGWLSSGHVERAG